MSRDFCCSFAGLALEGQLLSVACCCCFVCCVTFIQRLIHSWSHYIWLKSCSTLPFSGVLVQTIFISALYQLFLFSLPFFHFSNLNEWQPWCFPIVQWRSQHKLTKNQFSQKNVISTSEWPMPNHYRLKKLISYKCCSVHKARALERTQALFLEHKIEKRNEKICDKVKTWYWEKCGVSSAWTLQHWPTSKGIAPN